MEKTVWKQNKVIQLDGNGSQILLDAKYQIMSESWNRVVVYPTLIYMADRDRLLMSVNVGLQPYLKPVVYAMVTVSDDRGETWSNPKPIRTDALGNPDLALGWICAATYLGKGKVLVVAGDMIFFSSDFGDTWDKCVKKPENFNPDYSMFVDMNVETGDVQRIINPSFLYLTEVPYNQGGECEGTLWYSYDEGNTWGKYLVIPEWHGLNETSIVRAANGDLVAVLRSDMYTDPAKSNIRASFDHYSGLGVSISTDNGYTWSKVNMLYDWGRHHATIVLAPDGDLIMTYVVRMGYPSTEEGYPQFGIEAIVSKDNGRTWDLDHRYILATWKGKRKGPNSWFYSPQHAVSVLMPDGSILTAFGTGYRAEWDTSKIGKKLQLQAPRDVGLVLWKKNTDNVNVENTITKAVFNSDVRNKTDVDSLPKSWEKAVNPNKTNIAIKSAKAVVKTSDSDDNSEHILYDPWNSYCYNCFRLETIPAWVEISWPEEYLIDEIHVHPGAPSVAKAIEECVPVEYRLQYEKEGEWLDIVEPVTNAHCYRECYEYPEYLISDIDFKYEHKFKPTLVKKIRMYITNTSDSGIRPGSNDKVVVPKGKRKTILRRIDVFKSSIA